VGGLVSLSALLLLLWRPDELFSAGFQLTFGVVLGLIYLTPPVRRRWFGPANPEAATVGEMLGEWLKTGATASVVAWMVATPIAMHHFGMVSPLGAPLSIIAVPLSAAILGMGYLKMVLSAVLPSIAMLLGVPLSIGADVLLAIVKAIDATPLAAVAVPYPSATWTALTLLWTCWWALERKRSWQRFSSKAIALAVLATWLCWPMIGQSMARSLGFDLNEPSLRIDMLSVGDGSCYVFRSGGKTVMFDAGSSTDLNVGTRSLVPALRRLGVRSIDAIAISHADLDHYSAVMELAEEFLVHEVLVTPQLMLEGRQMPDGPVAFLLAGLTAQRVAIRTVGLGEVREYGHARWTWLHPAEHHAFERSNDGSMVIRITCANAAMLMCGDIQRAGMEAVMQQAQAQCSALQADVIELPHHGSHHEDAESFIESVNPRVVMQSTGWTRWRRDRWADALSDAQRLVTARDGACWVEVSDDGALTHGRFLAEPLVPGAISPGE
jgi:competence protein ComEC